MINKRYCWRIGIANCIEICNGCRNIVSSIIRVNFVVHGCVVGKGRNRANIKSINIFHRYVDPITRVDEVADNDGFYAASYVDDFSLDSYGFIVCRCLRRQRYRNDHRRLLVDFKNLVDNSLHFFD